MRAHGDEYRREHFVTVAQAKVLRHIASCRTAPKTGALKLTNANKATIPMQPPNPFRRCCLMQANPSLANGTGYLDLNASVNPVIEWGY